MQRVRNPDEVVRAAVDWAVEHRWERALRRAASTTGSTEERVGQLSRAHARELTLVGAGAGAAAAFPWMGAVTFAGSAAAELHWLTLRTADLVLAVGAVHGHTEPTVAQRRSWVLSVLAFGGNAPSGFGELAGSTARQAATRVPTASVRAINTQLCRVLVTRYGTRRGVVALCRAFPFGVGAVIGGAANYATVRATARHADAFFRALPPALAAAGPH